VQKGVCWSVSSSLDLDIWDSPWIPPWMASNPPLTFLCILFLASMSLIALFLHLENGIIPLLIPFFILNQLTKSKPSTVSKFLGPLDLDVKSAHELAFGPPSLNKSPLWSLRIQLTPKYLLWKISWNILPMHTNVFRFLPNAREKMFRCPFCLGSPETLQYIFLGCPFARRLWHNSCWPLNTSALSSHPLPVKLKRC